MKLTLIQPRWQLGFLSPRVLKLSPLGLALIAALTPEDFEIEIIDENVEKLKFTKTDIVGISIMTSCANRAYEIADEYRKMGIKVILGGIHTSMMPEEACRHADSIIIGEADNIWPEVLKDFKENKLEKRYRVKQRPNLSNLPFPKRELLKNNKYPWLNLIQTGRGCGFGCDFCSVSEFNGKELRHRPINHVIEEIKSIRGFFKRYIFFVDDNISADYVYAEKLFKSLIPLNTRWISQSSITIAKNEKLLRLASESGCKGLFIGFESSNQRALNEIHKPCRTEEYEKLIKKIHDYGIAIEGSFIFGFDCDDRNVFKETVDFCCKNDIEVALFTALTPFPGTKLFFKFRKENRILTYNWDFYDGFHVVFKPKNMSPLELQNGILDAYEDFYANKSILKRVASRCFKLRPHYAILTGLINIHIRKNGIMNYLKKISEIKNDNST